MGALQAEMIIVGELGPRDLLLLFWGDRVREPQEHHVLWDGEAHAGLGSTHHTDVLQSHPYTQGSIQKVVGDLALYLSVQLLYSVTNAMGKTMVCTPLSKYEVKLNLLFRYCVNVLIELNEMVQVVNSQYFGRALPERRINVIFA